MNIIKIITQKVDRIEFTVKFRQAYTLMARLLDHSFEHGNLICEILLSHSALLPCHR